MNPLMLFMSVYKFFAAMPFFWKVLRNFGTLKELSKEIAQVIEESAKKGHPSCEDTQKIFAICRRALETGIIDIPNFDERLLVTALYDLENNLVCTVIRGESVQKKMVEEEKGGQ